MSLKFEQQTKGHKKINVTINLENIHISFLRNQLKCLLKSLEIVTEYHKFQNVM